MTLNSAAILCLAYIVGLLSTAATWGGYSVIAVGIAAAIALPRFWRVGSARLWLVAGVVGLLATFYFQLRTPQPAANDISKFIPPTDGNTQAQIVTVEGKVTSTPRLTRSQKAQFWLEATQLKAPNGNKEVTGKLYVTVPLLQATGIYPGSAIALTGSLYKPKAAANPGAFDFRNYLAKVSTFAGFKGNQVNLLAQQTHFQSGLWFVRQRIIQSQIRWLGSPEGPLVSSIVLGHQAVDLPYDIQDQFVQQGLAHAIVASGFKVSLILGLLLTVTRRLSQKVQFSLGTAALIAYVALTGLHPPVLRAAVMGFGALVALVLQRRRKPLGSLLIAATLLLLLNPLWIWDVGFQLSFLATLGLMVTMQPLLKRLDWLPPTIASLVAVTIAASVWTLPLQIQVFNVVPLYSIVVNILTTPLISAITIGGMLSAVAGLFWPLAGSALAWLLYYPTHILIGLIQFFCQLPGNGVTLGTVSFIQLSALYSLISLVWLQPWWQRRWWLATILAISLVLIPAWYSQSTLFRVTVLAAPEPVIVIQDKGKVILINSGNASTARFTVLPFLQQQGVNQIDWAIATESHPNSSSGWLEITPRLPIKTFYQHINTAEKTIDPTIPSAVQARNGSYHTFEPSQTVSAGSTVVQLIDAQAPIWQFQIQGQTWLLLGNLQPNEQKKLALNKHLPHVQVLCWLQKSLTADLLEGLRPEVAIASAPSLDPDTVSKLRAVKTRVFWTGRDGTIRWTPDGNFEATTVEATENGASF